MEQIYLLPTHAFARMQWLLSWLFFIINGQIKFYGTESMVVTLKKRQKGGNNYGFTVTSVEIIKKRQHGHSSSCP